MFNNIKKTTELTCGKTQYYFLKDDGLLMNEMKPNDPDDFA